MMRPLCICPLLVPAVLILSACGGGNGGNDEEGGADTTSEGGGFVASANAVCIDRAKQVRDQFNQQANPTTAQDYANLLPDRVPIEEGTVAELESIEPPAELADAYKTFTERVGGALKVVVSP